MAHIISHNLSIHFPVFNVKARSIKNSLVPLNIGGKFCSDSPKIVTVKGIDKASFEIQHGERIGLIGHNGSGKTTLLKALAGIYEPTIGSLKTEGKISSLFSLNLGTEPESTGYQNIIQRNIMLGRTKKQAIERTEFIANLSGLGDYLHLPVRTYSSGMSLRLAFSIATDIQPEILLLDEAVGAGDARFREFSKKRIDELISDASIMVLASHDNELLRYFCSKVIWLEHGKIRFYGDACEGIDQYTASTKC